MQKDCRQSSVTCKRTSCSSLRDGPESIKQLLQPNLTLYIIGHSLIGKSQIEAFFSPFCAFLAPNAYCLALSLAIYRTFPARSNHPPRRYLGGCHPSSLSFRWHPKHACAGTSMAPFQYEAGIVGHWQKKGPHRTDRCGPVKILQPNRLFYNTVTGTVFPGTILLPDRPGPRSRSCRRRWCPVLFLLPAGLLPSRWPGRVSPAGLVPDHRHATHR